MLSGRCASYFYTSTVLAFGLILGAGLPVDPVRAQEPATETVETAIVKCPDTRKNCAVGLVVANKKSHSFRIFQASEAPLVGKRRQLTEVTLGQKVEKVDLKALAGRVLVVEFDDVDRRTLYNARIITSIVGH